MKSQNQIYFTAAGIYRGSGNNPVAGLIWDEVGSMADLSRIIDSAKLKPSGGITRTLIISSDDEIGFEVISPSGGIPLARSLRGDLDK